MRRRLFIALSLLAHLALWRALPRARALPELASPRSIELRLHAPPQVAQIAPVAQPRERQLRISRPSALAPPAAAPAMEAAQATNSDAPPALDLRRIAPPGLAAVPFVSAPQAPPPPPHTETAPPAWLSQDVKAALAARAGPRGVLVALQHALTQTLSPTTTHLSHGRASVNQLGALVAATTKPIPSETINQDVVPAQREVAQEVAELQQRVGKVCMGNCGQTHDVSHITATVHFDHDAQGLVAHWRMLLPSGNAVFDAKVLAQAAALCGQPLASVANDRVPEWSEWKIQEIGYRWSAIERALDPLFRPPGVRDPASSDGFGLSTVVATAELVAVSYRNQRPFSAEPMTSAQSSISSPRPAPPASLPQSCP